MFNIINVRTEIIEFLIPVTIAVTAFVTILKQDRGTGRDQMNYFFALFFGLIHGLFSNYLRQLLGKEAETFGDPQHSAGLADRDCRYVFVGHFILVGIAGIMKEMDIERSRWFWGPLMQEVSLVKF
jgi:hypothetical protein